MTDGNGQVVYGELSQDRIIDLSDLENLASYFHGPPGKETMRSWRIHDPVELFMKVGDITQRANQPPQPCSVP